MNRLPYKVLYILWGFLFAVTAALGFVQEREGVVKMVLMLMIAVFFVPPWMILIRAQKEDNDRQKKIVRNLSIASLVATTVMLALNILSASWPESVGNVLHIILMIVSAPMMCADAYLMSLLAWACLLMGSMSKMH